MVVVHSEHSSCRTLRSAKLLISELLPGSWLPNWLQGKARISSPCLLYLLYSSVISVYCSKQGSMHVSRVAHSAPQNSQTLQARQGQE